MTAKKTTKQAVKKPRAKRKPKKAPVMTVELPKEEAPTAVENVKTALDALTVSPGWQIIRKILDDNIKYLEIAILDKIDPKTKTPIKDDEMEMLRIKRSLNIEVRDIPQTYKKHLDDTGVVPREFDPYFKTRNDIIEADRKERQ